MSGKTPEEFLSGGGAPAAKWPKVGFVLGGTVLDWSMADQTDYDTSEVLYWDKINERKMLASQVDPTSDQFVKMEQLIMTIQSEATGITWATLQNVETPIQDDDGKRRLFVKGALKAAVIQALQDSRGKLEAGAYIEIERVADKPNANPKWGPAHQYKATWTPAEKNAKRTDDFLAKPDPSTGAAPDNAADDNPWA